jgi:hypothetical protein
MKFKTLMIIKALVCLFFGPILLIFPRQLFDLLGASLGSTTSLPAREYGAALIGTLLLTWLARNVEDGIAKRAITWDLFVYDGLALLVTLKIQLAGWLNGLGWGIVFVYLFFTVGFGYFLLPQKDKKKS